MLKIKNLLWAVAMAATTATAQTEAYKDASLSFHERAKDLVSRMTLDEKINQVGHRTLDITRLGVKGYNYWNEALHGVARSGVATSFPSSRAMSSTWNLDLIFKCAEATANEARWYNKNKGKGLIYWCPTINMSRDPRWGRDEENYGEDPYLTGRIAVEYIKGMQGNDEKYFKTIATAKHFAANNFEGGRHNTSSNMDMRNLREYYLPAFEMAVKEGNVRSIMSAYNRLNEIPCCANKELLIDILRTEWGFNGFVVSDCDALDDIWMSNKHGYVATGEEASALSMKNGEDLNCGETFQEYCKSAINKGLMTEADIDSALVRVFEARFSVGEFDSNNPFANAGDGKLECDEHRALALQASREAIVLLKNQDNTLPLDASKINKIAVIGPYGNAIQLGGYSGTPTYQKTILSAVADAVGYDISSSSTIEAEKFDSKKAKGDVDNAGIGNIQNGDIFIYNNVDFGNGKSKLDYSYAGRYGNRQLTIRIDNATSGQIVYQETLPATANNWTTFKTKSIDLSEEAKAITGKHTVYLIFNKLASADDGNKYIINIDWFKFYNEGDSSPTALGNKVMYAQGCDVGGTKNQTLFDEAVAMAKEADYVILALGTDLNTSDESHDRKSLNLPGAQQQLLETVYAANKKTIAVLVTCSSLTINWAQENIPAIMSAWYDGQEQGQAISDVIFGNYNPGGKLTTTWYNSVSDLPSDLTNYDIRGAKYTYMYHDKTPLYPFGFGMSYTTYNYSNLKVSKQSLAAGEEITVSADITNTGKHAGTEIVQLYVHVNSSIERPIKQLVGFARVELEAGETKTVSIPVKHEQLSYYNETTHTFDVEQGAVDILVGASSADIRLKGQINAEAATVKTTYKSTSAGISNALKNKNVLGQRVYNISGYCVGTIENIESLPKGFYVAGDRKFVR